MYNKEKQRQKNEVKQSLRGNKFQSEAQLIKLFQNHCATLIQTRFRSYIAQKRYAQFLPIYRRFKEILVAGVKGWKVRRIMKLQKVKKNIKQLNSSISQQESCPSHLRIKRRNFCEDFQLMFKNGNWIEVLQKQKFKRIKAGDNKTSKNGSLNKFQEKINLKDVFKRSDQNTSKARFPLLPKQTQKKEKICLINEKQKGNQRTQNQDKQVRVQYVKKEDRKPKENLEPNQKQKRKSVALEIRLEPEEIEMSHQDYCITPVTRNFRKNKFEKLSKGKRQGNAIETQISSKSLSKIDKLFENDSQNQEASSFQETQHLNHKFQHQKETCNFESTLKRKTRKNGISMTIGKKNGIQFSKKSEIPPFVGTKNIEIAEFDSTENAPQEVRQKLSEISRAAMRNTSENIDLKTAKDRLTQKRLQFQKKKRQYLNRYKKFN